MSSASQKLKGEGFQTLSLLKNIIGRLELLFLGDLCGPKHICISNHGGQRRLKLMGKASDKILLPPGCILQLLKLLFQVIRHMIKVRSQIPDLILTLHPGPDA